MILNNILVLDIIDGHNTGACILRNGEIEYVASEERISSDFDCMPLEHIHHHIRSTRRQSKSRTLKYPAYRYPPILFVTFCILPVVIACDCFGACVTTALRRQVLNTSPGGFTAR